MGNVDQCWPMGAHKKNIGRSEKSHDLARNLNPNARTGTQVRFKSILAFESKISDLNLNARTGTQVRFKSILAFESKISDLNLTCYTGSKIRFKCPTWICILSPNGPPKPLVPARSPSIALPSLWSHGQCWPPGARQKNIGRSEKSRDLARNLNPNARTGTQVRFKSI